jgi:hypothetical protein
MNKPTNSPQNKGVLVPHPSWLLLFLLFICSPLLASNLRPAHGLSVALYPGSGGIEVEDTIRCGRDISAFEFILNTGLSPNSRCGKLEVLATSEDGLRTALSVTLETPGRVLKLHYRGRPVFSSRRLTLIPYTSLPHEILHNWWGNSVWVDFDNATGAKV